MSLSPPLSDSKSDDAVLTDEKLERVFREIEEASERRARQEEEEAASQPSPLDAFVMSNANNAELAKKRHRQSISVSRVGSYPDVPAEIQRTANGPGSPVPWSPPPLYRANTRTSTTSTLSTSSFTSSHVARQHQEDLHTTQKETIVGRRNTLTKAMSSALSKTLTRMRSRGAINEVVLEPGGLDEAIGELGGVVIGVKVHEKTTTTTETVTTVESVDSVGTPGPEGHRPQGIGLLPRVETVEAKVEVGTRVVESSTAESGPSRRMSITISAEGAGSRSRSGSINNLRGKLPLRSYVSPPLDVKKAGEDPLRIPGVSPEAEEDERDGGGGNWKEGQKGSSKPNRRFSYFAKALAQKLKRRKSGEDSDKDSGKESSKEKDREKGKGKSDKSPKSKSSDSPTSTKSEKDKKRQTYTPPTPILTSTSPPAAPSSPRRPASAYLDQPILKSPLLSPPELSLPGAGPGSDSGDGTGMQVLMSEAGVPLPPSPRRLPFACEIPLPPSPNSDPENGIVSRSPVNASGLLGAGAAVASEYAGRAGESKDARVDEDKDADPTMVPLPTSPTSTTFSILPSFDIALSGPFEHSSALASGEGTERRERLPASALPDSDFGPMSREPSERSIPVGVSEDVSGDVSENVSGDVTPAPSASPLSCPSPTRSEPGQAPAKAEAEVMTTARTETKELEGETEMGTESTTELATNASDVPSGAKTARQANL